MRALFFTGIPGVEPPSFAKHVNIQFLAVELRPDVHTEDEGIIIALFAERIEILSVQPGESGMQSRADIPLDALSVDLCRHLERGRIVRRRVGIDERMALEADGVVAIVDPEVVVEAPFVAAALGVRISGVNREKTGLHQRSGIRSVDLVRESVGVEGSAFLGGMVMHEAIAETIAMVVTVAEVKLILIEGLSQVARFLRCAEAVSVAMRVIDCETIPEAVSPAGRTALTGEFGEHGRTEHEGEDDSCDHREGDLGYLSLEHRCACLHT